jgi:hypothetical protein
MSEFASIIANAGLHQQMPESNAAVKSQTGGGKSFQEVLNNTASQQEPTMQVSQAPQTTGVSGAKLEQLRNDLMNRVNELGVTQPPNSSQDLLPELFYNKSRLGLLKEALTDVKSQPSGTQLMGRMQNVESEYNQLEAIMKSNKDLSPGELLGLQARLYQVSQHIEVMSKVVDQVTGGIKTILNTNV